MKHVPVALIALATAVFAWACSSSHSPSTPTATVTGVVVSGTGVFTARNATSQLTATANFSNGSTQNVTGSASWLSSNVAVATVSSPGLVTAVGPGTATISAAYQGSTGNLATSVTLTATVQITPLFRRLCSPFRARMEVTIAETGNSIGFNVTSMTITMRDFFGVVRASRVYSAADLTVALGSNHFNASQSRVLIYEAAYPGNVDTMDSTATIAATVTDDAGNTQTLNIPVPFQRDGC